MRLDRDPFLARIINRFHCMNGDAVFQHMLGTVEHRANGNIKRFSGTKGFCITPHRMPAAKHCMFWNFRTCYSYRSEKYTASARCHQDEWRSMDLRSFRARAKLLGAVSVRAVPDINSAGSPMRVSLHFSDYPATPDTYGTPNLYNSAPENRDAEIDTCRCNLAKALTFLSTYTPEVDDDGCRIYQT